ncbi:MAG TPA: hypothetical protein PKV06_13550 [bacterium]|nr:hypothetical protein [bacterium]
MDLEKEIIHLQSELTALSDRVKELESRKREAKKKLVIPTPAEVDAYFKEIGAYEHNIGQRFCDRYNVVDWYYKKDIRIVDWKAVARLWMQGRESRGGNSGKDQYSHM